MIKIGGPSGTSGVGKTDKAKKSNATGSSAFAELLTGEEATESVGGPVATGAVSGLWSLQANQGATEREERRRAIQYGDDLLDELDNLRLSLLTGSYTLVTLQNLSQRLAARRLTVNEPELLAMLDDVELRVQVELAKYGM